MKKLLSAAVLLLSLNANAFTTSDLMQTITTGRGGQNYDRAVGFIAGSIMTAYSMQFMACNQGVLVRDIKDAAKKAAEPVMRQMLIFAVEMPELPASIIIAEYAAKNPICQTRL